MIVWRAVRFAATLVIGTFVATLALVLLFLIWARVSLSQRKTEN